VRWEADVTRHVRVYIYPLTNIIHTHTHTSTPINTHQHIGPVLRHLEAQGEWLAWRSLASLALLYHHGGVLVPPSRYRPLRSLDCFMPFGVEEAGGGGNGGGRGLHLDLQAAFPGLVEERVEGGSGCYCYCWYCWMGAGGGPARGAAA
jgi:hypothetical protein